MPHENCAVDLAIEILKMRDEINAQYQALYKIRFSKKHKEAVKSASQFIGKK